MAPARTSAPNVTGACVATFWAGLKCTILRHALPITAAIAWATVSVCRACACSALAVNAAFALCAIAVIRAARIIRTHPVTAVLAFVATNVVAAFLVLWAAVLATANIALWAALLAGPRTAADTGLLAADLGAGWAAADVGIPATDAAAFARRGAVFAAALTTRHDDSFYRASVLKTWGGERVVQNGTRLRRDETGGKRGEKADARGGQKIPEWI